MSFQLVVHTFQKGKFQEAFEQISTLQGIELLKGNIYKSYLLYSFGKFDDGYKLSEHLLSKIKTDSTDLYEKYQFLIRCFGLINLARMGNPELLKQKINEITNLKDEFSRNWKDDPLILNLGLGVYHIAIAINNKNQGNLHLNIEHLKIGLQHSENVSFFMEQCSILSRLSHRYLMLGEYEQAREFAENSLKIAKTQQIPLMIGLCARALSAVNHANDKLDEAIELLLLSTKIFEQAGINAFSRDCFFNLIVYNLEKKNLVEANKYLNKLEKLDEIENSKHSKLFLTLAKARLLSAVADKSNLDEARNLLNTILQQEIIDHNLYMQSVLALTKIYFEEIQLIKGEDTLIDLIKIIDQIKQEVQAKKLYPLLIEILLFESRLSLIQQKMNNSFEFLLQADEIAREKKMNRHLSNVANLKNKLDDEYEEWLSIYEKEDNFIAKIKKSDLLSYIDKALITVNSMMEM